jgi:hypothetical protein
MTYGFVALILLVLVPPVTALAEIAVLYAPELTVAPKNVICTVHVAFDARGDPLQLSVPIVHEADPVPVLVIVIDEVEISPVFFKVYVCVTLALVDP